MQSESMPILTLTNESFLVEKINDFQHFPNHIWKAKEGVICFCQSGWALFTIDLKEYEIVHNSVLILPPGSIIRLNNVSTDYSAYFFVFSGEMLGEACRHINPHFFTFLTKNPRYMLTDNNAKKVEMLADYMLQVYQDTGNYFREQIIRNTLQSIMMFVYNKHHHQFGKQQTENLGHQDKIFSKFISLVHEYSSTQREVIFYANKICISPKYLTGICRNVAGDSAKKIIDNFAILEIKILLQSTELTIQEIADRLSFPDQSYLGRYFKRYEGMSPKEYRNKYAI